MLAAFVVATLGLALQPCAMAMQDRDKEPADAPALAAHAEPIGHPDVSLNAHEAPAIEHTSHEHEHEHEQADDTHCLHCAAPGGIEGIAGDCIVVPLNAGATANPKAKQESEAVDAEVAVAGPSESKSRSRWAYARSPPDPHAAPFTTRPLHILNCAFLK